MYFTEEDLIRFKTFKGSVGEFSDFLKNERDYSVIDIVAKVVADEMKIPTAVIFYNSGKKSSALPRMITQYFLYNFTDISLKLIGKRMRGLNHSTVVINATRIGNQIETDISLAVHAYNIEQALLGFGFVKLFDGKRNNYERA